MNLFCHLQYLTVERGERGLTWDSDPMLDSKLTCCCFMIYSWFNWKNPWYGLVKKSNTDLFVWNWLLIEHQTQRLNFKINGYLWMWLTVCRLNSTVECIPYHLQLSSENALQLIQQYPAAKSSTYICYTDLPLANSLSWMLLTAAIR